MRCASISFPSSYKLYKMSTFAFQHHQTSLWTPIWNISCGFIHHFHQSNLCQIRDYYYVQRNLPYLASRYDEIHSLTSSPMYEIKLQVDNLFIFTPNECRNISKVSLSILPRDRDEFKKKKKKDWWMIVSLYRGEFNEENKIRWREKCNWVICRDYVPKWILELIYIPLDFN